MRTLLVALALSFAAGLAWGEPITLKCKTSDGTGAVDLIIDLDKGKLSWGDTEYEIISVTDRYISAYEKNPGSVGGETWVIDRATGEYKRASVYMAVSRLEEPYHERLVARTFTGNCRRQMF